MNCELVVPIIGSPTHFTFANWLPVTLNVLWYRLTEYSITLLTFADWLLSTPDQSLLTLASLRAHELKARVTQEMDLMTRNQNLAHLLAIGRCF